MRSEKELVAFLSARLDEDEERARRVQAALDGGWNYFDETPTELIDPARALREVQAKRAMLAKYERGRRLYNPDASDWFSPAAAMFGGDMEWLIGTLAAVWSDHPDYREEWKP